MAFINSFEKEGNTLFKHRGQIPLILFLMAIPVVYVTHPQMKMQTLNIVSWLAVALSILGFVIRAISIATTPKGTSGRNTKEGQVAESLNTTGIYSVVRHPLYLGNYFMWIGIVMFTFNWWFVITVSLAFWLYYERIMFAEERFLERKFGNSYMNWANKTPAFIPCLKKYKKNIVPFSFKSVLRREYSGMTATVIGFVFIADLRFFFKSSTIELETTGHIVLIAAMALALILRSVKHYTKLLSEEGRS